MPQARKKAHCCGSGGGAVLTEAALRNARRRLRQAQTTGAELLLTACPHCRVRLEAVGGMAVEDIVDLLHREYPL